MGGHYASCAAKELLEHHVELDLIVVHEAEKTLVELANVSELTPGALAAIPGIAYRDAEQILRRARAQFSRISMRSLGPIGQARRGC